MLNKYLIALLFELDLPCLLSESTGLAAARVEAITSTSTFDAIMFTNILAVADLRGAIDIRKHSCKQGKILT